MLELEERVTNLDQLMAQLLRTVERTSREMREFKDEMRQFRERSEQEMREFKDEMRQSHERSEREMREFKDEMLEFKDEMRQFKSEINRKWSDLAKKMGTMAEDLVAPSIPRILKELIHCTGELDYSAVRVKRKAPQSQEFDVVAVCDNYVLINETKSHLKAGDMDDFYQLMTRARAYFPEFGEKKYIGAIASLRVDNSLVRYGEELGLIVLDLLHNLKKKYHNNGQKLRG